MKYLLLATLLLLLAPTRKTIAQSTFTDSPITLVTPGKDSIYGTISVPATGRAVPVVLFIAGSGPTDRNGNSAIGLKSNCTLQLAHALAEAGIASVRYDKRGIAESKAAGKSETDLRFEDYITDARRWVDLLKKDRRFSKIIIAGHSEGSLIGMIASTANVDKFISLAGAGEPAAVVLKKQLKKLPDTLYNEACRGLDSLKSGMQVSHVNPFLFSLLRPGIQPYLISWFKYDPQAEIKKLKIPVLIIQGAKDLQIPVEDAEKLNAANPAAQLMIIPKMNHIFKDIDNGDDENLKSYANPDLPVDRQLVTGMIIFISKK